MIVSQFREEYLSLGLDGFGMHDYFYYRERFYRWSGSSPRTNAVYMFASPAFVRESFNASPEAKRSYKLLKSIVDAFEPKWSDIPYYFTTNADTKAYTQAQTRIWQTDPEYVNNILQNGQFYKGFYNHTGIKRIYDNCLKGQGFSTEQNYLLMVILIENLWGHYTKLAYRVNKWRKDYYYNVVKTLENKSDKVALIDIDDSSISVNEKYEAAEKLWAEGRYKESLIMHQKIYDNYKHRESAYRCGVAYIKGYGVKKNVNIAGYYMFIPDLDNDHRSAAFYRGMILIDKFYNFYDLKAGIEMVKKSHSLGVKDAEEILKKYDVDPFVTQEMLED